jgi:hypothetical protein
MKARRLAQIAILDGGSDLKDDALDQLTFSTLDAFRDDDGALKQLKAEALARAAGLNRPDVAEQIRSMIGCYE